MTWDRGVDGDGGLAGVVVELDGGGPTGAVVSADWMFKGQKVNHARSVSDAKGWARLYSDWVEAEKEDEDLAAPDLDIDVDEEAEQNPDDEVDLGGDDDIGVAKAGDDDEET